MTEVGRRGFFGTLLGGTAAAEMLAALPEPKGVERIDGEKARESIFVLTLDPYTHCDAIESIRIAWNAAFCGDAPPLLILDAGTTLHQFFVDGHEVKTTLRNS